jgi:hypothetical protein
VGEWVQIDVPDDMPEHDLGDGSGNYPGVYKFHKDFLNTLPLRFESAQ